MKKIFAFGIIAVVLFASCSNAVSPSGSGSSGSGTGTNTGSGTGTGTTVTLPAYALGETFTVNCGVLKSYSKGISDVTVFNGTLWNYPGTFQFGTIKNGVMTIALTTPPSDILYSPSSMDSAITSTNSAAKIVFLQGAYVRKDGDASALYYASGSAYVSGTTYLHVYMYSTADTKVSGSFISSETKFTFDLDLKKGWNSVEMSIVSGTQQEQVYKTAKATTFSWSIQDK